MFMLKSVIGATRAGGERSTIAFFSLPLYFASSSLFVARTMTTSPSIFPFVPGDQPAAARVIVRPLSGSMRLAVAVPRTQPTGIVHGSRRLGARHRDGE